MIDQMNKNPLTATGTPTFVTGALTVDSNQGAQLSGATNFFSASDSTSLSITGSLSVELFVKLASIPGTNKQILVKTGSYGVAITSAGNAQFQLVNGATSLNVDSNVPLQTNRWYHIVCVYNGNYAGVQRFGKTDSGSSTSQVDDTNGNNKAVSRFTLQETALLRTVNLALEYADEVWSVQMCAVVYADSAGSPGALVTKSDVQVLNPPAPQWRSLTWVPFSLTPALVPAGNYHIGYVADTIAAIPKAPLVIGSDASGGTTSKRPDDVSGPSDPFGAAVSSSAVQMAAYCDYTATSRTGNEGKALIYIDGALNVSAAYSGGIGDTANTLDICPSVTAQVDEVSIWNKALSGVQIATHYTAH